MYVLAGCSAPPEAGELSNKRDSKLRTEKSPPTLKWTDSKGQPFIQSVFKFQCGVKHSWKELEGDGPLCCCAPVYQWSNSSGWEQASTVNLEFSGDTESTHGIESTQNLPGIQAGPCCTGISSFPEWLAQCRAGIPPFALVIASSKCSEGVP